MTIFAWHNLWTVSLSFTFPTFLIRKQFSLLIWTEQYFVNLPSMLPKNQFNFLTVTKAVVKLTWMNQNGKNFPLQALRKFCFHFRRENKIFYWIRQHFSPSFDNLSFARQSGHANHFLIRDSSESFQFRFGEIESLLCFTWYEEALLFHRVLRFIVVIMVDISTRTTNIPFPSGAIVFFS